VEKALVTSAEHVDDRSSEQRVAAELHRVVQSITAGLSLDETLAGVLRAVERLVGAYNASIFLVEPDGSLGRQRFTTSATGEPHWDDHSRVRPSGVTNLVLRSGELIAIEDTLADPRTRDVARPDRPSIAVLPMCYEHRDVGVLYANWREPHLFQPEDLEYLRTLATYGAIAIENARLHEQERHIRREAQEANQRLQRILAVVAHDLEGPLTMVVAYSELLRSSTENDAPEVAERVIPGIERAARRIQGLVNDLLFVSQMGTQRLLIAPSAMDLMHVLHLIISQEQAIASSHRLVLDGPARLEGEWDHERLANVFTKLISNAVKFSPNGGDVVVTVEFSSDTVTVRVTDQGLGIEPEQMSLLFQPFAQLDLEPTTKGAGLGLYIAKSIVEQHGGRIWVQSEPGRGSCFTVALPRWRAGQGVPARRT
jgi:signal transduction histidine kinase